MSSFLSPEWFRDANERLARAGAVPVASEQVLRVVFELDGAPSTGPHALTITLTSSSARVEPGDHLSANTVLRLSYDDARRVTSGDLDGSSALREGRVKIRGDVNDIVPLFDWLTQAHRSAP